MGSTILLADKSITIQKIVELTFADQNFVIKSVSDGQAALDAISQVRPDLILADISLPIRSGYDVCRSVRTDSAFSEFSRIPVILLAGIYETMDEDRARAVDEKAKEAGATELMSKPFDPQILTAKVSELLSRSHSPAGDQQNVFAESLNVSNVAPVASNLEEPPADDSERTMMLPKSVLMDSMFADAPVLEAAPQESLQENAVEEHARVPVNVEAISPAYEPVFDSEHDFGSGEEEEMESPVEEEPSILVPPAEDPFGEVFEEPQHSWSASPTTEEESPFGVPEPPAKIEEPVATSEPVETQHHEAAEEMAPPDSSFEDTMPGVEEFLSMKSDDAGEAEASVEEPAVESAIAETTASETADSETTESEMEAPSVEPPAVEAASETAEETYEDTWPGVIVPGHQPVEDLFEPEAAPLPVSEEEETDLEPDLMDETEGVEELAETPAAPQPLQVTDELVDRIAEKVVQKLSERVVSEIVWQVVPDLAEKMIRRELEKLHAGEE